MPDKPRRLAPETPLPPYSYVTGHFPHPIRDPGGHSFGQAPVAGPPIDPLQWHESRDYLVACDLFNFGYYWEAHEAWEGLWHACRRKGTTADFLKGLIKLAAAGVKSREGRAEGVRRHAARAGELFRRVRERIGHARYLGLDLDGLVETAAQIERDPPVRRSTGQPVELVFDFHLLPDEGVDR